jgi:hypothetical protein
MHCKLSGYECPPNHGTHHAPLVRASQRVADTSASASPRHVEIGRRHSQVIPSFVIMYKAAQGYLYTTLPSVLILLGPQPK